MEYVFGAILGYLLGSTSVATIISKSHGIDITKIGSNNPGASNVFMHIGKKYGVVVALVDILKAFISAEITLLIFPNAYNAAIIAGTFAVIGHIYPIFLKFKGGKGTATFLGLVLFYNWKIFVILIVLMALITVISNFIVFATFTAITIMLVYPYIVNDNIVVKIAFTFIFLLILYKHRENIKNLINGTETGLRER